MSQILSQWLNNDVGLSSQVHPEALDDAFRNGYLFGEIFHRYDLQRDFDQFSPGSLPDCALKNYERLEPTMRRLGIPFTARLGHELMQGRQGAAAKLLYQIRMALPKAKLASGIHQAAPSSPERESQPSYPSTPNQPKRSNLAATSFVEQALASPTKSRFQYKEHEFFVEGLKNKTKREDRHLLDIARKFEQVRIEQEIRRQRLFEEKKLKMLAEQAARVEIIRQGEQNKQRLQRSKFIDKPAPKTKVELAEIERQYKQIERAKQREKELRDNSFHHYKNDVDQFEQGLKDRLHINDTGIETAHLDARTSILEKRTELGPIESKVLNSAGAVKLASIGKLDDIPIDPAKRADESIAALLPSAEWTTRQTKDYQERIKARKNEDDTAQFERTQRRRKLMTQLQAAHNEEDQPREEVVLLEKLMRKSKQERRIAAQLMQVRHEKEIMKQNRAFREQQYEQQRQKEFEEAIEREHILCLQAFRDYNRETDMRLMQHQEILAQKAAHKRAINLAICNSIVYQIVDLSVKVAEYRVIGDGYVPHKVLRGWKTLFLSGRPLFENYITDMQGDRISLLDTVEDENENAYLTADSGPNPSNTRPSLMDQLKTDCKESVLNSIKLLDENEFNDYLQGDGDWVFFNNQGEVTAAPQSNPILAGIVDQILEITTAPVKDNSGPKFPTYPLKVSVLGKHFSGKTTTVKSLVASYGLKLLSPETLIDAAIQDANTQAAGKELDSNGQPLNETRVQLGQKLIASLEKGEKVDDSILVSLLVVAIKEAHLEIEKKLFGGWVLDDFPRTRNQAQLLEKELSGYEEPKAIKPGNVKRGKAANLTRRKSLVAGNLLGGDGDGAIPAIDSGIDLVLMLNISNDIAMQRATGRRLDPLTGRTYHLEFDPPPIDQPGIFERLVALDDDQAQLQHHIAIFEDHEDSIRDWYQRFQNIRVIEANSTMEQIKDEVAQFTAEIHDKKEKREASIKDAEALAAAGDANAAKAVTDSVSAPPGSIATQQTTATVPADHPADAPIASPAAPIPGNVLIKIDDKNKKQQVISREAAEIFYDQWATIESTYTDTIKFVFRALRRERQAIVEHFYLTRQNFKKFLTRPDLKQSVVETFQANFNDMEEDLRSDPEAKAELHQRAEDLRDKLWEICDTRKEDADLERVSIIEDRWVEDHFAMLINYFIALMQLEVDRHVGTKHLIADYLQEVESKVLEETIPGSLKLTFVDLPDVVESDPFPPSDLSEVRKREQAAALAASTAAAPTATPAPASTGKKGATANRGATSSAATNTKGSGAGASKRGNATAGASAAGNETVAPARDPTQPLPGPQPVQSALFDPTQVDNIYSPIINALNTAINGLQLEEDESKKDKKRSTNSASGDAPQVDGTAPVPDKNEHLIDRNALLRSEERITRQRLERIRDHAKKSLKELRDKGQEVYTQLEEWTIARFHAEMNAIRDMISVVREAIELEVKLPHELVLEDARFYIDIGILTYEPEPEPRPPSPVERSMPDQFTVLQLVSLAKQFAVLAPNGVLMIKDFIESIQRTAALSAGLELLPDHFINFDYNQLSQMCAQLDPLDTGFMNWRHFLMAQARVLPIPLSVLASLKRSFETKDPWGRGTLTWTDYMTTPLWFEVNNEASSDATSAILPGNSFNRPWKLKLGLFELFAVPPVNNPQAVNDLVHEELDPSRLAAAVQNMQVQDDVSANYAAGPPPASASVKSDATRPGTSRSEADADVQGPSLLGQIPMTPRATAYNLNGANADNYADESSQSPSTMTTSRPGTTIAHGQKIIVNPRTGDPIPADARHFDYRSFLLAVAPDMTPREGLAKAALVLAHDNDAEDGQERLTLEDWVDVFHQGVVLVERTQRLEAANNVADPYPRATIQRVVESALEMSTSSESVTFEAFSRAAEQHAPALLQCPLYVYSPLLFGGGKPVSRPGST